MVKRSEKFYLTPVKRSHAVLMTGVGSLVRTRSKITALVCDLNQWENTIPTGDAKGVHKDGVRDLVLKKFKVRDSVLEAAAGIDFLVSPPPFPENGTSKANWCLPLVRFPLAQVCSNVRCNRLTFATPSDPIVHARKLGCTACGAKSVTEDGRRTRSRMKRQVTSILVCPAGHIDEINFEKLAHTDTDVCATPDIRVTFPLGPKQPVAKCESCGSKGGGQKFQQNCTGLRPWVVSVDVQPEACSETMKVVERTSVQIYFASTKSAIFIPESGINEELLQWVMREVDIEMLRQTSPKSKSFEIYRARAVRAGFSGIEIEDLSRHIDKAFPLDTEGSSPKWVPLEVRTEEFLQLTSSDQPNFKSELLEFHEVNEFGNSIFAGPEKIIERVVAVEKLAETRMLDGFSRWAPKNPDPDSGIKQLWGTRPVAGNVWLPGYRTTGEGILFVFSREHLSAWGQSNPVLLQGTELFRTVSMSENKLSLAGRVAHSFSHAVMKSLADRCGYPLPGLRDRIYDLVEGTVGVLVYTADGDSLGTLGGVVEHAEGVLLESLISDALSESLWCAQDPVCNSSTSHDEFRSPGACHHCILVPETSCEYFNSEIDRGLIHGSTDRKIKGLFS